jgi:hypothetical protein
MEVLESFTGDLIIINDITICCNWVINVVEDGLFSWEGRLTNVACLGEKNNVIFRNSKLDKEIKGDIIFEHYEIDTKKDTSIYSLFQGANKPEGI